MQEAIIRRMRMIRPTPAQGLWIFSPTWFPTFKEQLRAPRFRPVSAQGGSATPCEGPHPDSTVPTSTRRLWDSPPSAFHKRPSPVSRKHRLGSSSLIHLGLLFPAPRFRLCLDVVPTPCLGSGPSFCSSALSRFSSDSPALPPNIGGPAPSHPGLSRASSSFLAHGFPTMAASGFPAHEPSLSSENGIWHLLASYMHA